MPRYIDADKVMEEISRIGGHNLCGWETLGVKALIDRQPTADVAPKSEVERLQEKVNRYKRYYFHHDYDKMIAEVLDKLDRFINANCIQIKDERGIKGYVTSGVHFAIAELKKKYTEGKSDE